MKKTIAGSALAAVAVVGLSGFAAVPAHASPFKNCGEAYAAGYSDIPAGHPYYADDLDGNGDGEACERPEAYGYYNTKSLKGAVSAPKPAPQPAPKPAPQPAPKASEFPNCMAAFNAGVYNIPQGHKYYHVSLDSDRDGVACEYDVATRTIIEGREAVAAKEIAAKKAAMAKPAPKPAPAPASQQVEVMPKGGADTGVPMKAAEDNSGIVAAGGALALAGLAGATVVARRRSARV